MIRPFIIGLVGAMLITFVWVTAPGKAQDEPVRGGLRVETRTVPSVPLRGASLGLESDAWDKVRFLQVVTWQAEMDRQAKVRQAEIEAARRAARARGARISTGGAFPADCIAGHESADMPDPWTAENQQGSSASGRYQIKDGTWGGYGGYSHAADAPPEVQNERANQLWNGGQGGGHWNGTGCPGTG